MKPDAPLLFEDMITRGIEPAPTKPSNISKRVEFKIGDMEAGFAAADEIVEKEFKTAPVHQAYIEPHACVARVDDDGQAEIWGSSQGHFEIRALTAKLLGMRVGDIRVYAGRDRRRLRRQDDRLSRAGRDPARQEIGTPGQDRDEPRRGVQGDRAHLGRLDAGQDRRQEGRHDHRRRGRVQIPGRRLPRLAGHERLHVRVRPLQHRRMSTRSATTSCATGRNRPPTARRARRSRPLASRACSTCWPRGSAWTRCELRLKNAARPGTQMIYGPKIAPWRLRRDRRGIAQSPGLQDAAGPEPGARCRLGLSGSTAAANSSASVQVNEDGTVIVATGSPDIGGSRASMALMAAETLGIDYNQMRSIVADTASIGFTGVTGGSRVTFATGMAVIDASKKVVDELRARAALIWDVDVEGVVWEDGQAKPASSNVGDFPPLSLKEIGGQEGVDRRPDHRGGLGQCRRHGTRLLDPVLRCRGRSRDRQGDDPALCRRPGRRLRDPPLLCRGADPGRRGAGHRLGLERGVHLRSARAGSTMPGSSTTACRSPPTCR